MTKFNIKIIKHKIFPSEYIKYLGIYLDSTLSGKHHCDHVMKGIERVIEKIIRKRISIDDMQFGFMPGRGTTDAIFILRQLQEKHLAKNKKLYFAFVDLEKAFDHVPRKVMVGHAKTWHRGMYCAIRAGYVQQHQKQR